MSVSLKKLATRFLPFSKGGLELAPVPSRVLFAVHHRQHSRPSSSACSDSSTTVKVQPTPMRRFLQEDHDDDLPSYLRRCAQIDAGFQSLIFDRYLLGSQRTVAARESSAREKHTQVNSLLCQWPSTLEFVQQQTEHGNMFGNESQTQHTNHRKLRKRRNVRMLLLDSSGLLTLSPQTLLKYNQQLLSQQRAQQKDDELRGDVHENVDENNDMVDDADMSISATHHPTPCLIHAVIPFSAVYSAYIMAHDIFQQSVQREGNYTEQHRDDICSLDEQLSTPVSASLGLRDANSNRAVAQKSLKQWCRAFTEVATATTNGHHSRSDALITASYLSFFEEYQLLAPHAESLRWKRIGQDYSTHAYVKPQPASILASSGSTCDDESVVGDAATLRVATALHRIAMQRQTRAVRSNCAISDLIVGLGTCRRSLHAIAWRAGIHADALGWANVADVTGDISVEKHKAAGVAASSLALSLQRKAQVQS